VRVLVGRADVMRPKFEQQMIADLGTHQFSRYRYDRFVLPYMNRLRQLVTEPVYQRFDAANLANASLMISAKKGTSLQDERLRLSAGNDVKLEHLQLSGSWKITGENQLKIGETVFLLDPAKGMLTAKATADPAYDTYEIQLPRVLN